MADMSTAIMDKKRSPNRLIVDEATNDDNSVRRVFLERFPLFFLRDSIVPCCLSGGRARGQSLHIVGDSYQQHSPKCATIGDRLDVFLSITGLTQYLIRPAFPFPARSRLLVTFPDLTIALSSNSILISSK